MNPTQSTNTDVEGAFRAEAGRSAVRNQAAETEYSINYLKEEINKVVWMFAASQTSLKEADDLSCRILELFVRNREKYGGMPEFQD